MHIAPDTTQAQDEALAALKSALGASVVTDAEARFKASFDNLRLSFLPDAVIFPEDEDAVATVLKLANRFRIPVTPRGGGTAATGAASPVRGGWVLDLSRWTSIHIDPAASLAYVQPGAIVADIQAAASAHGLFYPPDPSSLKYCTIGGNVATNAGGMRCAKYGVTRDYVLALEGFLPTGEWVRWGMDLRKFVSGFNIRDLWIGGEGCLGVITGIVLKLIPAPQARHTLLSAFPDEAKAIRAGRDLLAARLVPSIMEFLDRQSVGCAERHLGRSLSPGDATIPGETPSLLLVEFDGHPTVADEDAAQALEILEKSAATVKRADTADEAEALWEARRKCSPAMFQMGNSKLNEDVVLPADSYEEMLAFTLEIRDRYDLATPTFGHLADGNLHVHVMYDRDDADQLVRAEKALQEIMEKVVALGGAITGEHGIGLAKSSFLTLQHSPAEIAAMQAVKQALDPNGILNPGKIFEPFRPWEHAPVSVKMPWDH